MDSAAQDLHSPSNCGHHNYEYIEGREEHTAGEHDLEDLEPRQEGGAPFRTCAQVRDELRKEILQLASRSQAQARTYIPQIHHPRAWAGVMILPPTTTSKLSNGLVFLQRNQLKMNTKIGINL